MNVEDLKPYKKANYLAKELLSSKDQLYFIESLEEDWVQSKSGGHFYKTDKVLVDSDTLAVVLAAEKYAIIFSRQTSGPMKGVTLLMKNQY
ncbi:hypothetical protein KY334_01690 [Candidatus Woesearchaeota archaeon]|nr:hypothetical protein [Candidatus Woesearchaeota archaeon]